MGRKSRFDRRSKGSSYKHQLSDIFPQRGRSRTRSPTPERRRDESPYPRGPRQPIVGHATPRNVSPSRGAEYGYANSYPERQQPSVHARDVQRSGSGSPYRRREYPLEDYRGERHASPV